MQRNGEASPSSTFENRNNRTSEGLPHGFWAADRKSSGGQTA
jgi:hypothetical protein